jgi:hypothetical protein
VAPDDITLDHQLCFALYGASMAIGRAYKPLLDALGITYPQYLVLSTLWERGAQSVGGIAERLALESRGPRFPGRRDPFHWRYEYRRSQERLTGFSARCSSYGLACRAHFC